MLKSKPRLKELPIAGIIFEPGTSEEYYTGDWRTSRPVIDTEVCTKCGMCYVYCPDGAIQIDGEGQYTVDLRFCKGCGICAAECAPKAIRMVDEEETD